MTTPPSAADEPRADAAHRPASLPYDAGVGPEGAEDETMTAEVITDATKVHVTLDIRPIEDDRVSSYVGSNILLVWDRDEPDQARRLVNLPVDIDPATAVVAINNGVCDMTADRSSPDANRGDTDTHHDHTTHTGANA